MSDIRIKLFSFNSQKSTTDDIESIVNAFLKKNEIIILDTADIEIISDDYSIIKIVYKLRKSTDKNTEKNKKYSNAK